MEQKISTDMSRRIFRKGMKHFLPDSIRLRDIKTAGSLKPMSVLKRNPKRKSLIEFIQLLKDQNLSPFLDLDIVEKWSKSKNSPYALYPWMILSQLGYDGKLDFNSIT